MSSTAPASPTVSRSTRLRLGALTLPLAAVLYGIGLLVRGPFVDPANSAAFLEWASQPTFTLAWLILMFGSVTELLSFGVLYNVLVRSGHERIAFAGLLAGFVGRGLGIGFQGLGALSPTPESAQQAVTALLTTPSPVSSMFFLLIQLGALSPILFSIGLWRSQRVPVWIALPYGLHVILLNFGAQIGFPLEVAGAVCLLISGVFLVRALPALPESR